MMAVGGWAADARGVFVSVDGIHHFQAVYGDERPDVAGRLGAAQLRSGFDLLLPTDQLAPGRHSLTIKIVSSDGRSYFEPRQPVIFEIGPPER